MVVTMDKEVIQATPENTADIKCGGYKIGDVSQFKIDREIVENIIASVFGKWLDDNRGYLSKAIVKELRSQYIKSISENKSNADQWLKLAESMEKVYTLSEKLKNDMQKNSDIRSKRPPGKEVSVNPGAPVQDYSSH